MKYLEAFLSNRVVIVLAWMAWLTSGFVFSFSPVGGFMTLLLGATVTGMADTNKHYRRVRQLMDARHGLRIKLIDAGDWESASKDLDASLSELS